MEDERGRDLRQWILLGVAIGLLVSGFVLVVISPDSYVRALNDLT
jgi:hypothetical protein